MDIHYALPRLFRAVSPQQVTPARYRSNALCGLCLFRFGRIFQ